MRHPLLRLAPVLRLSPAAVVLAALPLAAVPAAGFQRTATGSVITLTLDDRHLAQLGLEVAGARGAAIAARGARTGDARAPLFQFDFTVELAAEDGRTGAPPVPSPGTGAPDHPRDSPALDLELAELYGLSNLGRAGLFPDGTTGFSAVTTVCNVGEVPVPWVGPGSSGAMGERHPFSGLAMYRETADGALEMIGTSWIKHGFNVLPTDKCNLGCATGPGGQLNVGCSDTYSAGDNGTQFYLGPREELDPYAATWEACGSFFDATPADCERDYFGSEASPVAHRLAVTDADLDVHGARFFFEAIYWVADDVYAWNGTGWRECSLTLIGGGWVPNTPGGNAPEPGPLAASWGDKQGIGPVARDDGEVVLSVRVTALVGGQWHYEYALFNWRSRSGVGALEIPVGTANVTNVGFRDLNGSGADDWTATVSNGTVRWSAAGQALRYQTMFNFRFDADLPPVDAMATAEAFDPGIGRGFPLATRAPAAAAPDAGARGAVAGAAAGARASLAIAGANPAAGDAAVAVTMQHAGAARVTVLDAAGRAVRVLADGRLPAGRTELRWDGRDARGARAAAGVYFVRLTAGGTQRTEKVTRLP